jgi:hypothetical protein
VHDKDGKFLFNKYRRNPIFPPKDAEKYMYDQGASMTLYGLSAVKNVPWCVLAEGELKALALMSLGIPAISSTGGCNSFKDEWLGLLPQQVFICYDTDEAGKSGARKIHQKILRSRIIELPAEFNDLTDYLAKHTADDFMKLIPQSIVVPYTPEEKKHRSYETENDDAVARAKAVPITTMVNFSGNSNKARCLWHEDGSPSMHLYEKDNRVYCFGCDKFGDAIDVFMKINDVDFRTAVETMVGPKIDAGAVQIEKMVQESVEALKTSPTPQISRSSPMPGVATTPISAVPVVSGGENDENEPVDVPDEEVSEEDKILLEIMTPEQIKEWSKGSYDLPDEAYMQPMKKAKPHPLDGKPIKDMTQWEQRQWAAEHVRRFDANEI